MNAHDIPTETDLELRCGELVEVRSEEEILATLDVKGELDRLPFMPEMLRFCGSQLRVYRRAHKTCDTITGETVARRMGRCVHLEGARCDGEAHGGCQAACLIFWKEAWLRRLEPARPPLLWRLGATPRTRADQRGSEGGGCTLEGLRQLAVEEDSSSSGDPTFRCQATQLLAATSPLPWWEPGQYLRDWLSGNVPLLLLLRSALFRILYKLVIVGRGYHLKVRLHNGLARLLGETPWRYLDGRLTGRTPAEFLHLQVGEMVTVKSHEEILETLSGSANRGLVFAPEMVRYCGGTYRVRARVDRIINERTGEMMQMRNDCIILEDVICQSECSSNRLFCPRSIYPYWREIWLRRAGEDLESP